MLVPVCAISMPTRMMRVCSLFVALAVERKEAQHLEPKEKLDKRNLHLAKEGVILEDSPEVSCTHTHTHDAPHTHTHAATAPRVPAASNGRRPPGQAWHKQIFGKCACSCR